MRLIDVNTLEFKEFFGQKPPVYAILSHTWKGDTEVTFKEWKHAPADEGIRRKEGYAKILGACRRAKADGLQYLWCDTNCIDKSSSAELGEAINSMFAWYRDSHVCYAYLYDVQAGAHTFAQSRWFTRGWTLQELLAPSKLIFFDHRWTVLGDKNGSAKAISDISRIHTGALEDCSTIYNYSIAQRMSWAADRQTSRLEDIAYCLLGIFNINMPLLYGEEQRAFTRLQLEIIKVSDDQSILAWDLWHSDPPYLTSVLAPSPSEFRLCGSIVTNHEIRRNAYSITNLGLSIKLALFKTLTKGAVLVGLNCAEELHSETLRSRLPGGVQLNRHFRIWIPVHLLGHRIYARAHHPSSKVFLQQSYAFLRRPTLTELFLSLNPDRARPARPPWNPIETLRRYSSPLPSGVLVAVGSGEMAPHAKILKEANPLGNVSIVQLKSRGACTISHQLISSNSLSVVFSVFWSEDVMPLEWMHTILYDPGLKNSSGMTSCGEWNCLFEAYGHTHSAQCCHSSFGMRSIHEKLREVYGKLVSTYVKRGEDPIIFVENHPMRDSFEKLQLVVDIVFREPSKSLNV